MATDPLQEPLNSRESIELSKEMLSVQQQISNAVKSQQETLKTIGDIDSSVENKIKKRFVTQEKLLKKHMVQAEKAVAEAKKAAKLQEGADRDVARHNMKAAEDKMKSIIYEMEISKIKNANDIRILLEKKKLIDEEEKKKKTLFDLANKVFGVELKELSTYFQHQKMLKEIFKGMSASQAAFASGLITLSLYANVLYHDFERAAAAFRKFAGLTRGTSKDMRAIAESITLQFANVGVNIDGAYKSLSAFGSEMGGLRNVTKDLVMTGALLQSQLGVSEENTVGMLRNMAAISKSTIQSQKSMAYFAGSLSDAAGIPLNEVMGDVAKMSGTAFTMVSKMPLVIIKTAVEARRLNTTLNDMARASESILNFTESVQAEMEASVLIGHGINLQRARELAYRKDILGSTKEILNIAKQIDFENLDVFQMRAFAQATGRSVEELQKMLQADKEMDNIRRSTDPKIQAQLKAFEAIRASNEATAKDMGSNYELMLQQKSNQEMMVAIQNQWNKLLMNAGIALFPIVHTTMQIVGAMVSVFPYVTGIAFALRGWLGTLGTIGRFLGLFGRFLGPLGIVIGAFQLIASVWRNVGEALKGNISIWQMFGNIIYDVVLKPFQDAWTWIKGIFVGASPSKLALGIVKGITSVGSMLFDALTYPWRQALAWIAGVIPGMGGVAEKLKGGLKGIMGEDSVQNKVTAAYVPAVQISPNPTPAAVVEQTKVVTSAVENAKPESDKTLTDILMAINNLNKNLESGKIGVYIDGQLMSATIARQTNFKGGFGMNTV